MSETSQPPSVRSFLRAFGGHWFEYMSGGPSVPLMVAALVIQNHALAIGTGLLGIGCGVLAAYFVWRAEREKVIKLENKLARDPRKDEAVANLLKLRSDGIRHRNKDVNSDLELDEWIGVYTKWRQDVLENAQIISEPFENWLERLDRMGPLPLNFRAFNGTHANRANIMSEMLTRMMRWQEKEILGGSW